MSEGNSKAQQKVKARRELRTGRLSTCSSAHTQHGLQTEKKKKNNLTNLRCLNIHNLCPGQWLSIQPADAEKSLGRQGKKWAEISVDIHHSRDLDSAFSLRTVN